MKTFYILYIIYGDILHMLNYVIFLKYIHKTTQFNSISI